jgi:hypothetical protein
MLAKILAWKSLRKRLFGRSRYRLDNYTKTGIKEIRRESVDCIRLDQDKGKWVVEVNKTMNLISGEFHELLNKC